MVTRTAKPSLIGLDLSSFADVSVTTFMMDGKVVDEARNMTATEVLERQRERERVAQDCAERMRKWFRDQTHMDEMYAAAARARRAGAMGDAKHTLELGPNEYESNGVRGDDTAKRQTLALCCDGRQDRGDKS